MRLIIFLLTFLSIPFLVDGQVKVITGKVVDEFDLWPIPEVRVQILDTVRLGITDINGNFKIELPFGIDEVLLISIGMERTSIKVPANCNNLEIVMVVDGIYHSTTTRRINRKRHKIFKDLPKKHNQAYDKGIFTSVSPCMIYIFEKY